MKNPCIGILIPTFNEDLVIRDTLDALYVAGVHEKDIYVVDDCSTDNTAITAARKLVNVVVTPTNGGKAKAQNFALNYNKWSLTEKYDWIIFLDGDTKVDPSFYEEMLNAAKNDPSVALYIGKVRSAKNNHIFSAYRTHEYTYGHDMIKMGQNNFGVVYVGPGCASMYRTDILSRLDIDSSTLAEDMDLTIQVHKLKEKIEYIEEACVDTQDPKNLRDYYKQVQRWSRGFWQVLKKHAVFKLTPKKERVEWYLLVLALDGLLMNRFMWLLGALILFKPLVFIGLTVDLVVFAAIGAYSAFRSKRWDVLLKLPLYYWLTYVNLYAFIRGFVEVMILQKKEFAWNKVKRYQHNVSAAQHVV